MNFVKISFLLSVTYAFLQMLTAAASVHSVYDSSNLWCNCPVQALGPLVFCRGGPDAALCFLAR